MNLSRMMLATRGYRCLVGEDLALRARPKRPYPILESLFQFRVCGQSGKVSKMVNSSVAPLKMRRTCWNSALFVLAMLSEAASACDQRVLKSL
jgi:hypothetical protein